MQSELVELKVENQIIRGDFFKPIGTPKRLAILFLHGWTGKPTNSTAEFLSKNGYTSFTFSFRGHNNSDGNIKTITTRDSLNDALVAYDFLKSKIPNKMPFVVVGNSYGSYIAAILSASRSFKGISLRVPANYPDENLKLPKWGRGGEDPTVASWRLKK